MSEGFQSNVTSIKINNKAWMFFIYAPKGFKISKLDIECHDCYVLGRLSQFNRLKALRTWREELGDLVKLFTSALTQKGWDFNKYPNPIGFIGMFNPDKRKDIRNL